MMGNNNGTPKSSARRRFLKRAGIGMGVAVGAGAGIIPLQTTPYDAKYPVFPENDVELPDNGRTVIILGGGLSGLQAGVELAARGFRVQILEKTGTPGGKLKTWRDKSFGPADDPAKKDPDFEGYVREHGIHAVWGFYNNLREFIHRHGWGLQDMPPDTTVYLFMDKDGSKGADEGDNDLPAPLRRRILVKPSADVRRRRLPFVRRGEEGLPRIPAARGLLRHQGSRCSATTWTRSPLPSGPTSSTYPVR